jgi:hypothetical protein
MLIYRYLTGQDDASFCHKVTKALSEGWQLYGNPTLTFNSLLGQVIAGQAVTREAPDQPYDPDKKLVDF